jgi:hypothetical protein
VSPLGQAIFSGETSVLSAQSPFRLILGGLSSPGTGPVNQRANLPTLVFWTSGIQSEELLLGYQEVHLPLLSDCLLSLQFLLHLPAGH